ncbi:DNA-3-methyladenine glycosylase 2 family protein [Verminephrobacter eiseniae]|nr:AlkA N-terminal domain-containing protein [Verminephrobacter eiseniae]MCW5263120.1 DNA-3-methyladenine glycosylase 2 family protein [Verminephrobacter eiseniae]
MTQPPQPPLPACAPAADTSDEGRYLALLARDARFDGHFFTGVTSTGIYCRPVCAVRTPRRDNCRFFTLAAQAERAGFRPCLRCRPELAPQALRWSLQDASAVLVQQAVRLLDAPELWAPAPQQAAQAAQAGHPGAVARLAQRLGVSDRHLRRIFEAALGVSPLQYLQTRRLLTAKQLLTDTTMPVTDIALASGFASLRRFNAAFAGHYRLNPTQLRRSGADAAAPTQCSDASVITPAQRSGASATPMQRSDTSATATQRSGTNATAMQRSGASATAMQRSGASATATQRSGASATAGHTGELRLAWRPPLDVAALLAFFARRQLHGVEWVLPDGAGPILRRTVRLAPGCTGQPREIIGWISARFDGSRHLLLLQASDSLYPVLPLVIRRVRALLDLDADPAAINAVLHPHFPQGDGLRLPGAFDGFELAVRAVLGQQVTLAAARTLGQRLVERLGQTIATPWPELHRLFPSPATLAATDGAVLGQMGIVRQRQAAIVALARAVDGGQLALHDGADPEKTTAALCALPGIGDWTAQYIAMRVLRWPDAFPSGDVALHKALGLQGQKNPARAATAAAQAWRPWRSYALLRAWAGAAAQA